MSYSRTIIKKSERGPKTPKPISNACGVCGSATESGQLICQACKKSLIFLYDVPREVKR
jgi:hypothetical protein